MTATLSMVPLAQIRPSKANPRADFDDERMAELIDSVKLHGIITPLTLSHDGEGRYAIIAGERRYRAAKAAKLREVPAQVREVDGEALTLAVAENVIRADLTPVEEAEAYRRLVEEHGDAAKVAKLVGRSERLIGERLELLRLPEEAQELVAARKVPLACAPLLVRIAEREPLLADLTAAWLAEHPAGAGWFPTAPGEVVDDVLAAEWQDDDGKPLHPVAYSVGGWHGPILPGQPRRRAADAAREARRARRAGRGGARGAARDRARVRVRLGGAGGRGPATARVLRPHRRGRRRRARVRLPARAALAGRPARAPLRHRSGVARGSARAEDRRPRRRRDASGASGSASSTRRPRPTTPRRRRAGRSGSASTRSASRRGRGTSTSARRSRAGSRSSTPTR